MKNIPYKKQELPFDVQLDADLEGITFEEAEKNLIELETKKTQEEADRRAQAQREWEEKEARAEEEKRRLEQQYKDSLASRPETPEVESTAAKESSRIERRDHPRTDNSFKTFSVNAEYYSGNIGSFTRLFLADIMKSVAFRTLRPVAKLVLIDMLREAEIKGSRIKGALGREVLTAGFKYTQAKCQIDDVGSHKNFVETMKQIVDHGFFERRFKKGTSGYLYTPSRSWQDFAPSDNDEIEKLEQWEKRRAAKKKV